MAVRCQHVFNVPVGAAFLPAMADAILDGRLFPGIDFSDPFTLARLTIYLPNRRAARALREVFFARAEGRTLLLPAIRPLGEATEEEAFLGMDTDASLADIAPAIAPLERQLKLAQLTQPFVAHLRSRLNEAELPVIATPADALALARELARFMDELEAESVPFSALEDVVPQEMSEHWSLTLKFLEIIGRYWPEWLAETGQISPGVERNLKLHALARHYGRGLKNPVIIAGSTGSIPATAALMAVVGADPMGAIVLPGLDRALDDAAFAALTARGEPVHGHPQFGLAKLLQSLGCTRDEVADIALARTHRAAVIAEAMRPSESLEAWARSAGPPREGCEGLAMIEAANAHEEALAIALAMRHAAGEGKSANLVTPDRGLARRVSVELGRWGIAVDDSAGQPLAQTPPGIFVRSLAHFFGRAPDPVELASLLKHPLARFGLPARQARRGARVIELAALRGFGPFGTLEEIRAQMAATMEGANRKAAAGGQRIHPAVKNLYPGAWNDGFALIERVMELANEYKDNVAAADGSLHRLMAALRTLAEKSSTDDNDAIGIYEREAGEALAGLFEELCRHQGLEMAVRADELAALIRGIMAGVAVRRRYAAAHGLRILGLLEARLQGADLTILGGLNEGAWPDVPQNDAFLSRPMRAEVGLPPPERRIGQAAHDFTQGLAGPRVILTRALKDAGGPKVASRWWQRLEAYLSGHGCKPLLGRSEPCDWIALARRLREAGTSRPVGAPKPVPPLALRPRSLSITEIETWQRNPYAIHAKHVLRLMPLEPIGRPSGAAVRGTLVHGILEAFAAAHPAHLPPDTFAALLAIGKVEFAKARLDGETAFWWPRFVRAAQWFAEAEMELRAKTARVHVELSGSLALPAPGGDFTLRGRADRVDVLTSGLYAAYDYKTGTVPSARQIEVGMTPQLSLEAAMLARGAFAGAGLPAGEVADIAYIKLSGSGKAGEIMRPKAKSATEVGEEALEGLARLVARFDDDSVPYEALRRPQFNYRFDDYAHLARVREWRGSVEVTGDE